MLARVTNMRGVDLTVFQFDYDLTWAALMLDPNERVLGRFGGRDADDAVKYLRFPALRHAMRRALTRFHQEANPLPVRMPPFRVEQYAEAGKLTATACIHCHQAFDFDRAARKAVGIWNMEDAWVYPLPENLGFSIAPEKGDVVARVQADTAAAKAGLHADDRILQAGGEAISSFADLQYALHRGPAVGEMAFSIERGGNVLRFSMQLRSGWRETDLSWRASSKSLGPSPAVHGEDLVKEEKAKLGLRTEQLAFRQGNFVTKVARQAGIRQNDVVLGIEGRHWDMTVKQFEIHVRMHYREGDTVKYHILRDGKRLLIPLTLPSRSTW